MAYYLFNLTEPAVAQGSALREIADARLRAGMWGVDAEEPHRDRLAPGDLILIYLAEPERTFIGHAVLATAVREWTLSEAQAYPGDSSCGVLLSEVEEWDQTVLMDTVVPRIDPAGTDPVVQENAKTGFPTGVVAITTAEYEMVHAVQAERRARRE